MLRSTVFKRVLLSVLSFQIATAPLLAYPHTGQVSLQVLEAEEFQKIIQQSEQIPAGQPRGSFGPDRYLLLEQEAHVVTRVGRAFGIFSSAVERDIEYHRGRVHQVGQLRDKIKARLGDQKFEKPCAGFADVKLSPPAILGNLVEHLNGDGVNGTPGFVWEFKDNPKALACIQERVQDVLWDWNRQVVDLWEVRKSLDAVPNVTQASAREAGRYYNWWTTSVNVVNKNGDEQFAKIPLKNTADHHSIDDRNSYSCPQGDSCQFEIVSRKNVKLNSFHIPVKSITTFGPYVVWVHNDSYDKETGIQYFSFLDLSTYSASIGRADIPVFRLPIHTGEEVTSLAVQNKSLIMNGKSSVIVEAFMAASEMQQISYNITSNLVSPEDVAKVLPYIDAVTAVFDKTMTANIADAASDQAAGARAIPMLNDLGKSLKDQILNDKRFMAFVKGKKTDLNAQEVTNLSSSMKTLMGKYTDGLLKSEVLQKRMAANAKRSAYSRELKGKLDKFFRALMVPSPNASLKIKRALVAVGVYRNMTQGKAWQFLVDRPWLYGAAVATGIGYAANPEAFMKVAEAGLAVGNGILDYTKFAVMGVAQSMVKGTYATFGPLVDWVYSHEPSAISRQYIDDGNWWRTLVGLSFYIPITLMSYWVPHTLFNLHHAYIDSRESGWSWNSKNFTLYMRKFVRDYYKRLGDDEMKRRKITQKNEQGEDQEITFTEEEKAEIEAFIEGRKTESKMRRQSSWTGRIMNWFRGADDDLAKATRSSEAAKRAADPGGKIKNIWAAVSYLSFSYPAMELTLGRWVQFWNWFAGMRYNTGSFLTLRDVGLKYNFPIFIYRVKPITGSVRLLFPDFFTTTVAKQDKKLTIPTALNGGTRTWQMRDMIWLKESLFGKPAAMKEAEDDLLREMTASEVKSVTEEFEKEILGVEEEVQKVAFAAALRRLPEFITDKDVLLKIFTDKPFQSVAEKRIRELPSEVRTFIRLYFEEIYGATMGEYLKAVIQREDPNFLSSTEGAGMTLAELKARLIQIRKENRENKSFNFSGGDAAVLAERVTKDNELFKQVAAQARKGDWSIQNFIMNRKFHVIGDMDPKQNPSMERYADVKDRMASPNALSRAIRAEISKLLITFPLNLAFKLALTAGIFEGAFKPIQEHFLGPNSVFYLSRDSFYMTMLAGFVMGMMADAWVKLQTDSRQDALGDFGAIPKGEDAQKGIWSWFVKQFKAKNNSVGANWKYANKIAFWNFPAALTNMALFYGMFSGRLDFSFILAGYALTFGTPLNALAYKIDQAFERAAEYAARGVKDERWLAHPGLQALISAEKQRYRNRFQLLADIYLNIAGNWQTTVEMLPTSYGPRGFARALFGGPLLEEAIVEKILHPVKNLVKKVPVVDHVVNKLADGCEYLLTNGNVDLRLKK
jgi:hypothetical protein